jgi:hypothetical protein
MGASVSTVKQESSVQKTLKTASTMEGSTSCSQTSTQSIHIGGCCTTHGNIENEASMKCHIDASFDQVAKMDFDDHTKILSKAFTQAGLSGITVLQAAVTRLTNMSSFMLKVDVVAQMETNCALSTNQGQSITIGGDACEVAAEMAKDQQKLKEHLADNVLKCQNTACIEAMTSLASAPVPTGADLCRHDGDITNKFASDAYGTCIASNSTDSKIKSTADLSLKGSATATVAGFDPGAMIAGIVIILGLLVLGGVGVIVAPMIMAHRAAARGTAVIGGDAGATVGAMVKVTTLGALILTCIVIGVFFGVGRTTIGRTEGKSWWPYLRQGSRLLEIKAGIDELNRMIGKLQNKTFQAQMDRAKAKMGDMAKAPGLFSTLGDLFMGKTCTFATVPCGSATCEDCVNQTMSCTTQNLVIRCKYGVRVLTEAMHRIQRRQTADTPTTTPVIVAGSITAAALVAWFVAVAWGMVQISKGTRT